MCLNLCGLFAYRLDVEGLVHCVRWVTVAELGCGRTWGAIVQHQRPGESKSAINNFKVNIKGEKTQKLSSNFLC